MANSRIQTDVSVLSGNTGVSVTPEECISGKKNNMKSLSMLPPRKGPIQNQDINMLGNKKDQILPPQLAKFRSGYKSLINEAYKGRNDSTDTLCTDKEDCVDNLKSINNINVLNTNTNITIRNITTVMKLSSTKLK